MESSSLVKAHDHARAAAVATRQSADTTVAINEHTQAAGEFATAAHNTSSVEALRTLKLLEEHHRRLAELLSLPADQPAQQTINEDGEVSSEKDGHHNNSPDSSLSKKEGYADSKSAKATSKPGLPQPRRIASREMSSSIASNLASARGIRNKYRTQPLTPSVSNDQAPGNLDPHPRRDGSKSKMQTLIDHQPGKPTWVPPVASPTTSNSPESPSRRNAPASTPLDPSAAATTDDAGYTRFYNTFGSLINRISAPLAFAGLPLIQEESTLSEEPSSPESSRAKASSRPRPSQSNSSSVAEPDLSKIWSKATMNAISKDGPGPSDSFYVVPTSGHTISYANILSYAEKEKRRLEASHHGSLSGDVEDDDDDFVDARETPVALSPGAKRRIGRARTDKELNNTIEELYTENKSLKDMLDKLTKRLHAFEASAQNMAESYRLMRPGSPPSSSGSRAKITDDEYAVMKIHMEKLEKENKKMQKTLDKYREKWETLKAGAKARREAQGGGESAEDSIQN